MDRVLSLHVMVANNLFHETGNGRDCGGCLERFLRLRTLQLLIPTATRKPKISLPPPGPPPPSKDWTFHQHGYSAFTAPANLSPS